MTTTAGTASGRLSRYLYAVRPAPLCVRSRFGRLHVLMGGTCYTHFHTARFFVLHIWPLAEDVPLLHTLRM